MTTREKEFYFAKMADRKKEAYENYSALKEALSAFNSDCEWMLGYVFNIMDELLEEADKHLREYMDEEKCIETLVEELITFAEDKPTDTKESVYKSQGIVEAVLYKSVANYIPSDIARDIRDRCKTIMNRSAPEDRTIYIQMQQQSNQAETPRNHANNTQDAQEAKENLDSAQNILPTTVTEADIQSAIKTLLDSKDENGKYIMENKTQWWAVYQFLIKTGKIKIPQNHFAETIKKWFPDTKALRIECTQSSVSKKPQGASDLPKRIAEWARCVDSAQYTETLKQQCRVVKALCHIFSAQSPT